VKPAVPLLALVLWSGCAAVDSTRPAPNILFLSVDDMANWVACLDGHPGIKTPNFDRLARRGVLFTNAHCTSPICGPSRAAVLTGMRPETTGVYHNRGTYVDYVPNAVSIQKHFMAYGYRVLGAGKVNHGLGMVVKSDWHEYGPGCGVLGTPFLGDELDTAKMNPTRVINRGPLQVTLPMNGGLSRIDRPNNTWDSFDWGPLDAPDEDYPDHRVATWAQQQLGKRHDQPFFLAAGFYKPHQPFFVPRRYFEMYPLEEVQLPKTIENDLSDVPAAGRDLALRPWTSGTHATVTKHGKWREAVRAYLATISFVDDQVGRVLDALDAGPNSDNTWIVLWSDHGWSLGEKEHWGKHVPWKESVRVPLIIVPPVDSPPSGFRPGDRCYEPVNLLDLYPTLVDACGHPPRTELEGRSLVPLMVEHYPALRGSTVVTIGRGSHSLVTDKYRYIHYYDGSEELYLLGADPNEWQNLASFFPDICRKLRRSLPRDRRLRQFVRQGRWKLVIGADDSNMLFDMHAQFGISEQTDVAADHPEVIKRIRDVLSAENITDRHVDLTDR
jgi:arylsulfatase A-like enzyme